MDVHMKKVHGETEYMRLDRITKSIKTLRNKEQQIFSSKPESYQKPKKIVGDEKAILILTSDLTDALATIPLPEIEENTMNLAEEESKVNLFQFVNKTFHTPSKTILTCQWCSEGFDKTNELIIHAKKHHREEYSTQEAERAIEAKEDSKSTDVSEAENQH